MDSEGNAPDRELPEGDDPYELTRDEIPWVIAMHVSGMFGWLVLFFISGFPGVSSIFNVLPAAAFWFMKRDDSWRLDDQGKEAVNFSILVAGGAFLAQLLQWILPGISTKLGFLLIVTQTFLVTLAAIRAWEGKMPRYPLPRSWRVLK